MIEIRFNNYFCRQSYQIRKNVMSRTRLGWLSNDVAKKDEYLWRAADAIFKMSPAASNSLASKIIASHDWTLLDKPLSIFRQEKRRKNGNLKRNLESQIFSNMFSEIVLLNDSVLALSFLARVEFIILSPFYQVNACCLV